MKVLICILVGFFLAGCGANLGTFSLATTGSVPVSFDKDDNYVEEEHCVFVLLGIPIGELNNRITVATAKALEKANANGFHADALHNVTIRSDGWSAILFGQNCIVVRGQPVKNLRGVKQTMRLRRRVD